MDKKELIQAAKRLQAVRDNFNRLFHETNSEEYQRLVQETDKVVTRIMALLTYN